jgi:photosystem II stability/assembly factor-like uncharacterized protein
MLTPTEAWAVAGPEILHTTDGGATWEKQPRPGTERLAYIQFFDPQNGIASGNTTLYTRNGGLTWTASGYQGSGPVEMANANLAFITDGRVSVFARSTDGGATWTNHSMPSNISRIQCFDSLNCVALSPSGTYHSTDGGLNWTLTSGLPGSYFISHNQGWYVSSATARRTTDGGATWQTQSLPGGSWIYDAAFADANNGVGVGANMVRTTDGGATWQEVPLPQESLPLWDVHLLDAQHGIAGGDTSGTSLSTESVILTSSNGGVTWTPRTSGSIQPVLDLVALDHDHGWASHNYGGKTSRTTDGGETWRVSEVAEQYAQLESIDMADQQNGWTVGYHNTFLDGLIYRTTDGGATWQQQFDPGSDYLLSVAVLDAQTAIIVGGYNATGSIERRTTDGGVTWHPLNLPTAAFFSDVFFLDNSTGWMASAAGQIIKTTDGGDTWVQQPSPAQYSLASVHFSDPNNGWAGGYYGTLLRTTNGGATWTVQDPRIPEFTHVLAVNSTSPMRGWIAGYGGGAESRPYVKYTTDSGANWIEHTPPVGPYDSFPALAFVEDEYGWAGGWGGIFRHSPSGFLTPTPTRTSTPTSTSTPGSLLIGHVTWQGRPAPPNSRLQVPVTLTLKSGATEVNYEPQYTDPYGFFTVTVSGMTGPYSWRVDDATTSLHSARYLANLGAINLNGDPITQAGFGVMRAGDATNDNIVNSSDFVIVRNSFGCSPIQCDERADFNGDTLVNSGDFNLLRTNFGTSGSPPLGPGR